MGFVFAPIGFLPNTLVHATDMNANFAAIQNASQFWGEWINTWSGFIPGDTATNYLNENIHLTLEDYTTQDPVFAPNGLQFIRLRPSFNQDVFSSLGMDLSAAAGNGGNIYDAVFMSIVGTTYLRYALKHGNGKRYPSGSNSFTGIGAGTFSFADPYTPTRAKFNYGYQTSVGTAQTIGYSSLGSTTVVVAVSASVVAWTGHVLNA